MQTIFPLMCPGYFKVLLGYRLSFFPQSFCFPLLACRNT